MEDRRSWLRFTVQFSVKLRKLNGSSEEMEATVVDVSFRGIGIETNQELQPGTEISIEWPDPPFYFSGEAIANGTVVNVKNEKGKIGHFRLSVMFSDSESELAQSMVSWAQNQSRGQKRVSYY